MNNYYELKQYWGVLAFNLPVATCCCSFFFRRNLINRGKTSSKTVVSPPAIPNSVVTI